MWWYIKRQLLITVGLKWVADIGDITADAWVTYRLYGLGVVDESEIDRILKLSGDELIRTIDDYVAQKDNNYRWDKTNVRDYYATANDG